MTEYISILQGYIDHLEYMNKFAYNFFNREQANKDIEAFKAAIKALEQEPCKDTISRILKRIWNCRGKHTTSIDKVKMEQILREELPPVNPQPKWIPVSEGLPKIADVYRVTRYFPNNVMNPNYLVDACFFDGSNTWYNDNKINHERAYVDNVIAWQENPEPYESQGSEE